MEITGAVCSITIIARRIGRLNVLDDSVMNMCRLNQCHGVVDDVDVSLRLQRDCVLSSQFVLYCVVQKVQSSFLYIGDQQ